MAELLAGFGSRAAIAAAVPSESNTRQATTTTYSVEDSCSPASPHPGCGSGRTVATGAGASTVAGVLSVSEASVPDVVLVGAVGVDTAGSVSTGTAVPAGVSTCAVGRSSIWNATMPMMVAATSPIPIPAGHHDRPLPSSPFSGRRAL